MSCVVSYRSHLTYLSQVYVLTVSGILERSRQEVRRYLRGMDFRWPTDMACMGGVEPEALVTHYLERFLVMVAGRLASVRVAGLEKDIVETCDDPSWVVSLSCSPIGCPDTVYYGRTVPVKVVDSDPCYPCAEGMNLVSLGSFTLF